MHTSCRRKRADGDDVPTDVRVLFSRNYDDDYANIVATRRRRRCRCVTRHTTMARPRVAYGEQYIHIMYIVLFIETISHWKNPTNKRLSYARTVAFPSVNPDSQPYGMVVCMYVMAWCRRNMCIWDGVVGCDFIIEQQMQQTVWMYWIYSLRYQAV